MGTDIRMAEVIYENATALSEKLQRDQNNYRKDHNISCDYNEDDDDNLYEVGSVGNDDYVVPGEELQSIRDQSCNMQREVESLYEVPIDMPNKHNRDNPIADQHYPSQQDNEDIPNAHQQENYNEDIPNTDQQQRYANRCNVKKGHHKKDIHNPNEESIPNKIPQTQEKSIKSDIFNVIIVLLLSVVIALLITQYFQLKETKDLVNSMLNHSKPSHNETHHNATHHNATIINGTTRGANLKLPTTEMEMEYHG